MDKLYNRLLTPCTLSETSLEECALRMRPSWVYTLHVANRQLPFAIMLVKRIGAFTQEHPFAPQINVTLDIRLKPDEWFIGPAYIDSKEEDPEHSWGSEGL